MERDRKNNMTKDASAKGGVLRNYARASTLILSGTLNPSIIKIVGNSCLWEFGIKAFTPQGGVTRPPILHQRDSQNRYALVRGDGYEIVEASYSKHAIALKITATLERSFHFSVTAFSKTLSPVMSVENRFWYAGVQTNENGGKKPNTVSNGGSKDTFIEKSILQVLGLKEEVKNKSGVLSFSLNPGESVYLYLGVGETAVERTPKESELKNGIEARILNHSLNLPTAKGSGLGDLTRILPLIYGYKTYNENMGALAYVSEDKNADMEICALVGILAGDIPYEQIIYYARGGVLTAINTWIAFITSRNHDFLRECYLFLKKHNPLALQISSLSEADREDKLWIYTVMELASRVVAKEDNLVLSSLVESLRADCSKDDKICFGSTPLDCYLSYLSLVYAGNVEKLQDLRSYALSKFNASKKGLEDYLYYLIAFNTVFGVHPFSSDIRPSINFGALWGEDFRTSNLSLWSRKISLASSKEGVNLAVGENTNMNLVGSNAYIYDFKEEIGGVSFIVTLPKGATITLITPVFSQNKAKNNPFKLRLEQGKWCVKIKNNTLKVEKA